MDFLVTFRTVDAKGNTTRIVQIDYYATTGAYYYVTNGVVSFDAYSINHPSDLATCITRWIHYGDTLVSGWGE